MSKATQCSLRKLKAMGYTPAMVERFNPFAKIRQDLFGIVDIIAIKRDTRMLAVQSGVMKHHMDHIRKILASRHTVTLVSTGCDFQLWSWAKQGERGKRKLWTVRMTKFIIHLDRAVAISTNGENNESGKD